MPLMLQKERLDDTVLRQLHLTAGPADMTEWKKFVARIIKPKKRVKIAVVGKYIELQDAYKSIYESLTHAAASVDCGIDLEPVEAEALEETHPSKLLQEVAGVLVPGGFGDRGVEGKVRAAQYAREQGIPFLGLCLGMQIATIEFARNVCGIAGANSTEFDPNCEAPVIDLLEEQKDVTDKGASMRLGSWVTKIAEGTKARAVYGQAEVRERHRHRYEFNMKYRAQMEAAGFVISGTSPDGTLVELIELKDHPFYLACQYHPEFQSKPNQPHPLFRGFVTACLAQGG
jgi:CTP synthase